MWDAPIIGDTDAFFTELLASAPFPSLLFSEFRQPPDALPLIRIRRENPSAAGRRGLSATALAKPLSSDSSGALLHRILLGFRLLFVPLAKWHDQK